MLMTENVLTYAFKNVKMCNYIPQNLLIRFFGIYYIPKKKN